MADTPKSIADALTVLGVDHEAVGASDADVKAKEVALAKAQQDHQGSVAENGVKRQHRRDSLAKAVGLLEETYGDGQAPAPLMQAVPVAAPAK